MLISIFLIIIFLLILDGLWLNFFMIKKYRKMIYDIQGKQLTPRYIPVVLFYIVYSISIYLLIFKDNKVKLSNKEIFFKGLIMGISSYATYDLTNLALFDKFDTTTAIIDILWGGIYTGITCVLVNSIMK